MKPLNNIVAIGILDIKRVHFYTLVLSAELKPSVREALLQRYHNVKCGNCGMPVLEHEYDSSRDIVLHWKGNCAISMTRKGKEHEKIHDARST